MIPAFKDNYDREMEKYKKKPGDYQMPELLAVWQSNSIKLRDMPSAISHHLFLGITKALFEDIICPYLTLTDQFLSEVKFTTSRLTKIHFAMWVKLGVVMG